MIKADCKYNGVVASGSQLYETQTGTLGYQVMLECPEGATSFIIWLTDKNRERAKKFFEILGVDDAMLRDPGYIEYQLGLEIEGREVSFGTRDKEYNGKHSVDVVWIGAAGARESVDYLEDLFALGAGNTAHNYVDSRYQNSK